MCICRRRKGSNGATLNPQRRPFLPFLRTGAMTQSALQERAQRELAPIRLSKEQLMAIQQAFKDELIKGLAMHKRHGLKWAPEECSFRMLDSCVNAIPTGQETGTFYALDFGGTNVRAVRCELVGNGKIVSKQSLKNLSECGGNIDLMSPKTTASQLFDVLVGCIEELAENKQETENLKTVPTTLGFTFSFPCVQSDLNVSILEAWTKGFDTGRATNDPVVGQDVVKLLTAALKRKNLAINCAAVVNDTVGTLLSCAYQKKPGSAPCLIGVILGTGSNCCYVEPEAPQYGYKGTIVNVESGNFNKHLPTTPVDVIVDNKSPNKGNQLFEKMISGFYLGELVRLLALRIFGDAAPPRVSEEFSFDTKQAAILAAAVVPGQKPTADMLANCKETVKQSWGWSVDEESLQVLQEIAFAVFDRSAALAAISIAAFAERTRGLENNGCITVAVDGSLYMRNKWYEVRMIDHLKLLMGEAANRISLRAADDGSGKGAAICVAALHK